MRKKESRDIVLVVDDSPETLRMLTDAIEDAGMTVLVAREGEYALSIIERVLPDIILMDALMPGTDGFETCRRLKQNKALAHVPVIFMTGLSDTEHIIQGLEAGGVDYVTKPLVPGELLARIRVHLANARISHSARTALDAFGRFLLAASGTGESSGVRRRRDGCWEKRSGISTRTNMFFRAACRTGFSNARPVRHRHRRRLTSRPTPSRPSFSFSMSARSGRTRICSG
jgi:CheY-like chemotaxis protein